MFASPKPSDFNPHCSPLSSPVTVAPSAYPYSCTGINKSYETRAGTLPLKVPSSVPRFSGRNTVPIHQYPLPEEAVEGPGFFIQSRDRQRELAKQADEYRKLLDHFHSVQQLEKNDQDHVFSGGVVQDPMERNRIYMDRNPPFDPLTNVNRTPPSSRPTPVMAFGSDFCSSNSTALAWLNTQHRKPKTVGRRGIDEEFGPIASIAVAGTAVESTNRFSVEPKSFNLRTMTTNHTLTKQSGSTSETKTGPLTPITSAQPSHNHVATASDSFQCPRQICLTRSEDNAGSSTLLDHLQRSASSALDKTILPAKRERRRGRRKPKSKTEGSGTASTLAIPPPQTYADIAGSITDLCLKDQSSCRHMQRLLRDANEEVQHLILNETVPQFARLMSDPVGNYFCQTAIQVCTDEELLLVLEIVWRQLPNMSKSLYGTRAVQKLILRCQPSDALCRRLGKAFVGRINDLAVDACGSHVVRELLHSFPTRYVEFIHAEIRSHVVTIATTKRGCCAVQKSLESGSELQKQKLIDALLPHIQKLVLDPFGNYVVQHVLNMGNEGAVNHIIEIILLDLVEYSKHKFASNVVELCLRRSNSFEIGAFVGALVAIGKPKLVTLLEDSYGNYVVQHVLEVTPHSGFGPLNRLVSLCLPDLGQTAHGRRIAQIMLAKYPFLGDVPEMFLEWKHLTETALSSLGTGSSASGDQASDNSLCTPSRSRNGSNCVESSNDRATSTTDPTDTTDTTAGEQVTDNPTPTTSTESSDNSFHTSESSSADMPHPSSSSSSSSSLSPAAGDNGRSCANECFSATGNEGFEMCNATK